MKITRKLLTLGKPARSGLKFAKKLERIIIHWIGPYPGQVVSTPWNCWENENPITGKIDGTGKKASAHFVLKDTDIIQCLPLDEIGWHSGDGRNFDSIGIEVIPMNEAGEFSKASIDTLRLLIQHIRKETGLDLPLKRHFDGTQGKPCPEFYTEFSPVTTIDNGVDINGQRRWEDLKLFLNDWDRTSVGAG
jgi:hypothetical protein